MKALKTTHDDGDDAIACCDSTTCSSGDWMVSSCCYCSCGCCCCSSLNPLSCCCCCWCNWCCSAGGWRTMSATYGYYCCAMDSADQSRRKVCLERNGEDIYLLVRRLMACMMHYDSFPRFSWSSAASPPKQEVVRNSFSPSPLSTAIIYYLWINPIGDAKRERHQVAFANP